MLLEKAFKLRKHFIRLIGIGVSNLIDKQRQLDIFDATLLNLEHLNAAIDRIRRRYGFTAIQTGAMPPLHKTSSIHNRDSLLARPCLSR